MSYIIRHPNGIVENRLKCTCFWSGLFSTVSPNDAIMNYVLYMLNILEKHITYIMPQSDGDILGDDINEYVDTNSIIIIGSVAQRFYDSNPNIHYLLLPQDDGIFEHGLRYYIWPELLPKWEDRQAKIFWRGSGSRRSGFLRGDVVLSLVGNPNADVKFIPNWLYEEDAIPEPCIGTEVNYLDFAKYKLPPIVVSPV